MKILPLVIGLAAGSLGGYLAGQNLGPKKDAPTESKTQIIQLQEQLKSSQAEIQKLTEAKVSSPATPAEGESKPDINKLFNDAKPLLKQLTAGFEPQRQEMLERMTEEQIKRMIALANLTPEQQAALKQHLLEFSEKEKAKWQAMLDGGGNLADMMKMGRGGPNPQKTLDEWAATNLEGEQAKSYETGRLAEKAKAITDSANTQLERMNTSLNLDETQKDQMFHVLVRTDKDYDPSMQMEGVADPGGAAVPESRDEAIAAILNPEQNEKYQAQQKERSRREGGFFRALGLPGPPQGQ